MCDESFSINCTAEIPEGIDKGWFMFFVTLLNQLYWVSGAALGGFFGSFIGFNTEGLDFVMTAMFVVIFLDRWLKDEKHFSEMAGLIVSAACLIIFGADGFIIPAMIGIIAVLSAAKKTHNGVNKTHTGSQKTYADTSKEHEKRSSSI